MRLVHKIATTLVLLGFPLATAAGCSPGTPIATPAVVAVQPADVPDTRAPEWAQFGLDAGHSGFNPAEKTIGAKNVSKLQIAWNRKNIIQPSGIVVARNVAYVQDMGQKRQGLYAFNATNGKQMWRANLQLNGSWGNFTHAVPVVAGGIVVAPCSNGSSSMFLTGLCGVGAKTGKVLWRTYCTQYQGNPCGGLTNEGTSPTYYDGLIYVSSVQGVNEQPDIQALNANTGAVVWDVPGIYHCPDAGLGEDNPLPATSGVVLAVLGCQGTSGATEVCALNAFSGSAAWCYQSPDVYVQDLVAGSGVFYTTIANGSNLQVTAFNATSGAQLWQANLPPGNFSTMATDGKRVFILDGNIGVYALAASNGKPLWNYTANANLFLGGALSIANGILYADGGGGNNGNVAITAFKETTGSVIWTSGSIGNGGAPATPVILDGTVYAGCYTMCAFRLPKTDGSSR